MLAAWTRAATRCPAVSVMMWRLRPLIFLPASKPRGPPLSVVLTDWLSITPAEGLASRPARSRACCGHGQWQIEVVKRSDRSAGFSVLPRRWVVERTFAWLNRNRRLAKDFETTVGRSAAWIYLA